MNKRTIWLEGLEIRKMTNKQIANYEFNARITNPNEPSDHELLLVLVKDMNDVKRRLTNVEDILKRNNIQ